jgi:hypothetical protein
VPRGIVTLTIRNHMNIREWKDIILLFAGLLLSIVGALIGAWIQHSYDKRHERRPLAQLLNFGAGELLFIYPHRGPVTQAILPRTSTEDFLAINNFISALIHLDWKGKISVRDFTHISPSDRGQNLVIICSPKSNSFTEEFQQTLKNSGKSFFYLFEDDPNKTGTVRILSPFGEVYISRSYIQEQDCLSRGVSRDQLAYEQLEDYAIITKVQNSWNEENIAILIAGIRGIGTWGAAEFIKKKWRFIYDQLPADAKNEEFSALLRITYQEYDIKDWMVVRVLKRKDATHEPPAPYIRNEQQQIDQKRA